MVVFLRQDLKGPQLKITDTHTFSTIFLPTMPLWLTLFAALLCWLGCTDATCIMNIEEFMECMHSISECTDFATKDWCGCFDHTRCKGWQPEETCNWRSGKIDLLKKQCADIFAKCLEKPSDDPMKEANNCVCEHLDCLSYGLNYANKPQVKNRKKEL